MIKSPDGAALLDVRAGTCLALNLTGLFIWERLALGQTEDAIVQALADECGEPVDNVRHGYASFVQSLVDHQLAGLKDGGLASASPRRESLFARLFGKSARRQASA